MKVVLLCRCAAGGSDDGGGWEEGMMASLCVSSAWAARGTARGLTLPGMSLHTSVLCAALWMCPWCHVLTRYRGLERDSTPPERQAVHSVAEEARAPLGEHE